MIWIKYSILFAAWFFLWPVALLFVLSKHRNEILQDMMADMKYRKANFRGINAVLYVFLLDRYYRTLFYHRVGCISWLIKWLWPGEKTFHPLCHDIGGGVFCIHPFSTILNANKIGENFSCRQNTTIGNKSDDKPNERPIIGNNVVLGANVVIIGNIRVGDNVMVGAGSVVIKDVPANCIVVGNPARVVKRYELKQHKWVKCCE